ncbi:MAG: hypothetical protein AAF824_11135 [Bacteroidota bacterium]
MNILKLTLLLTTSFLSCQPQADFPDWKLLTEDVPAGIPMEFKADLIPSDKLIHRGIVSPDLSAYYYTLSDTNFEQFDVYVIEQESGNWSEPKPAFFNSRYNEHGMSFSPDGNSIYFSSTRPVTLEGVLPTWHIWKADKVDGEWTEPIYVDIPNLRDKLASHPILTNSGILYFHASNLDYSEMDIYQAKLVGSTCGNAEKVPISLSPNMGTCTPYVSPNEDFILFAAIGDQLDLYVSFNDGQGNWTKTKSLGDTINSLGQGNPYVTADRKFLFFTTGDHKRKGWKVKWANIETGLPSR